MYEWLPSISVTSWSERTSRSRRGRGRAQESSLKEIPDNGHETDIIVNGQDEVVILHRGTRRRVQTNIIGSL